jgi:hypothetical protein
MVAALDRAYELGFTQHNGPAHVQHIHKPPPPLLRQAPQDPAAPAGQSPEQMVAGRRTRAQVPINKRRLFDDTRTEYFRIDTSSKRPRRDALTDRQQEFAAEQRQGD